MKRYISNILLTGISLQSFAQTSVWKVTNNDKTIYIGGTVHVLRPEDSPFPAPFDSAYAAADKLIFEADMSALENQEVAQQIMKQAMYNDERTLKSELDSATYALLESEFAMIQMPISTFAKFKPSMAVISLTMLKMQQDMGTISEGVDRTFYNRAIADGKQLEYLENFASF